jgi:ABC-type maltose transport system permease subunit
MFYKVFKNTLLTLFAAAVLIPSSIVILGSFKDDLEIYTKPLALPKHWSLKNFHTLIETGNVPHSDFVLIGKLESFLKVNLRKDKSLSSNYYIMFFLKLFCDTQEMHKLLIRESYIDYKYLINKKRFQSRLQLKLRKKINSKKNK